jgi:hypothetical protein
MPKPSPITEVLSKYPPQRFVFSWFWFPTINAKVRPIIKAQVALINEKQQTIAKANNMIVCFFMYQMY